MNYIIATYPDYDDHHFGTPWAAPCESTGRLSFKGKTGYFTGGRGKGGHLYVDDPEEGSVWAYGQKNYRHRSDEKNFSVFCEGAFHPISPDTVLDFLSNAPRTNKAMVREQSDEELAVFLCEIADCEKCPGRELCKQEDGTANGLIKWLNERVEEVETWQTV